ncbi:hypothetical protein ACHAWF_000983 [Thalassiosira exigua]
MLTGCDGGSLYMPDDLCAKTKKPVIKVLREKYPEGVIPSCKDFEEYVEDEEEGGPCLPVLCWEKDVAVMASCLQGTSGPCGEHSTRLRVELAEWTKLLENFAPNYAMYRGYGVVLGDADNGFNQFNRYQMLRLKFNHYRHHNIVVAQDEAERPPIIIHSREGVAQGCGFEMFLYGIGMMPLCKGARDHVADSIQT